MQKTCIIIAGPTAVGKTAIAIEVAKHFSTSIISADSRQCYKELNIGVAKPSAGELASIKHYFIDTVSITEDFSAADFETYALDAVNEIFAEKDIAIMVGGTGLYIKAFCEGLDKIPPADPAIRKEIIASYDRDGIVFLENALKELDPRFSNSGEMHNPQRMMRALEVVMATGRSITSYRSHEKKKRNFRIIKIGLDLPREILYQRINERVEQMLAAGLVAEVASLIPYKQLNALQTVGYSELFDYFDHKIELGRAIELIKQNTRHYAKRQLTWFKKDADMLFCAPEISTVMEVIKSKLENNI